MTPTKKTIRVNVDVTNPGHFFACCGLLELADRFWPGAEGWFKENEFLITCDGSLADLIQQICQTRLVQIDPNNNTSSPLFYEKPFDLRLDWWQDDRAGGKDLKVWAGTMESGRIAKAMQLAMEQPEFQHSDLFNVGVIAYDPENSTKKVEPFYFDARRGPNAHSRDVGFAANDLQLTTTAFPAVEFLCLVGLQRCLPVRLGRSRLFDYHTWPQPMLPELLPAAICGLISHPESCGFRFENWYRTGQKKHKAFLTGNPLS